LILYLDTSTLLKLYIKEEDSDAIEDLVQSADQTNTSLIAYAEGRAGLARAHRLGRLNERERVAATTEFESRWSALGLIPVSEELVTFAGRLTDAYPLRGYDAVHLASALTLQSDSMQRVVFSTSDGQLKSAARAEGLTVP